MKRYPHEASGHTGDCIYCNGFSYEDSFWYEECPKHKESEKRNVLQQPALIRVKINELRRKLTKAERAAQHVMETGELP